MSRVGSYLWLQLPGLCTDWATSRENLSLVVCDQQPAQLQSLVSLETLDLAIIGTILSRQRTPKVLIWLCGCWSDCTDAQAQVFSGHGSFMTVEHPPSLIRVFSVRMKKVKVLSYPLSAQRRLWSDWVDAQADLSLRWAHTHFVGFVMSQLYWFCPIFFWFLWHTRIALILNINQASKCASHYMSLVMRKPAYAICDQQRCISACTSAQSDQHLCFRCLDSRKSLVSMSEISSF